jgi:CRISPR/Cas system-associated exonuclease Cas4 (RecB family)
MKYSPYSFSKLSLHRQCNRRFKYRYIDKLTEEDTDKTPLFKGIAIHSILEKFPEPSNHKFAEKYQHIADSFIKSDLGIKYLYRDHSPEVSFGLDEDLNPVEYNKAAIFRGKIDHVCVVDDVLTLVDWKSGKYVDQKYQDFGQLMAYAIYFFKRYETIDKIRISYIYVEHDLENDITLERQYLSNYIEDLTKLIHEAENDTSFEKNVSDLCKWCPFRSHCEQDV